MGPGQENTKGLAFDWVAGFTRQFGDINETYYNSLESVMNEMAGLLMTEGVEFYPQFRERIWRLESYADRIGWGYGDYLREQVHFIENELGDGA